MWHLSGIKRRVEKCHPEGKISLLLNGMSVAVDFTSEDSSRLTNETSNYSRRAHQRKTNCGQWAWKSHQLFTLTQLSDCIYIGFQ